MTTAKLQRQTSRGAPLPPRQEPYFSAEGARKIARAVRLELRIEADAAAHTLELGAELFLTRFVLERKNPTSPAEIKRWARDVEKTAGRLFDVLRLVELPWLHITTCRDMPAEMQAAAAKHLGEHPSTSSVLAVAWLLCVSKRLLLEYGNKRGRRSQDTIGLAAFVLFAESAFRELFGEEPKIGTSTVLVGRGDADGGRQRFKARDGYFVRFMKNTAGHLAARIYRDDSHIAAALRNWTQGDTLADKSLNLAKKPAMERLAKSRR